MRGRAVAALAALWVFVAACSSVPMGRIAPELVGNYVMFGIDTGEVLELRVDGTYEIGSVGICPLPLRITGRWQVVGGRVVLEPLAWGMSGVMEPIPQRQARECQGCFVVDESAGSVALVDDSGEPELRWRRGLRWERTGYWRLS